MSHRPRKRFGQHFLTDGGVVDAILDAVAVQADDVVVEIGPGRGAMTDALAAESGDFHAIELDRDLARALRQRYQDNATVTVHEGDVLAFDFSALGDELRVVGNLPYNISTPLLFHLMQSRRHVRDMTFMLQKEVVDRMAAEPGSKTYGRLTVMLSVGFIVQPLFDVPPEAFDPPPAVNSSVVQLRPLDEHTFRIDDHARFSQLVAAAFNQRRKTLRNALSQFADSNVFERAGVDSSLRAEALSTDDFVRLANALDGQN
ncbi:MAG: 16S rRNA (adenine(1518)-N(6)/adenine(1519)-N(6))-dimethyltransferase RsmA [Pseudomonadota bacterium]